MKAATVGKNGIRQLYIGFVKSHLKQCNKEGKRGKVEKISRQKIEVQLLEEIDKWDFPIEYKLSWYHEVLVSSSFDGFWGAVSERFKLPVSCTTRYVTDPNLLEYDAPTDDEADEAVEDGIDNGIAPAEEVSPTSVPQTPTLVTDHGSRSSTPDSSDESSRESTPDNWPQLSEAALQPLRPVIMRCARCNQGGVSTRYCPCKDYTDDSIIAGPSNHSSKVEGVQEAKVLDKRLGALAEGQPAVSGDPKRVAREEEDDGEYEDSPSKTKGKGGAPGLVKAASKPHGVTKNRAAPKKKEQTPAQLKTAAAKTRESTKPEVAKTKPTKPKSTKNAVTTPNQTLNTPSHAASTSNNEQSQSPTVLNTVHHSESQPRENPLAPPSAGLKRTMEQFRNDDDDDEDDDDSPATKNAKIGGAASANGGRKKVVPQMSNNNKNNKEKNNAKENDFEEWNQNANPEWLRRESIL